MTGILFIWQTKFRTGLGGMFSSLMRPPPLKPRDRRPICFCFSSRLDPLPNVAIDAMAYLCRCSVSIRQPGVADFLIDSGLRNHCVAEYLDSADMTEKILALAGSRDLRGGVADRSRKASIAYFNMKNTSLVRGFGPRRLRSYAAEESGYPK